jgi:hypothetical protein
LGSKVAQQEFSRGNNIYYWSPENGKIARFGAGSVRANLNCSRASANSVANLGVRAVRQG